MRLLPTLALATLLGSLSGCVSEDAGYSDVRKVVSDRTGHRVRWNHLDGRPAREHTRKLLSRPLTANTAVRVALLNNEELQAKFEDLGIARANMLEALRIENPSAGAALHFHDGSPDIDVHVLQDISGFFFLPGRGSAGRVGIEAASLGVAGAVMDLTLEVRVAYYEHVAARQSLELARTVASATKAAYEAAKGLHQAGNLTDLDLANQRSLYEESRLDALSADSDQLSSRERLRALLGISSPGLSVSDRLSDPPETELSTQNSERRAVDNSLDISIATKRFQAAEKRGNQARVRGWVPEIKAGVSAERDEGEWGVGPAVELEVPLFDQGGAEVARARAEMRRAASEANSLRVEVRALTRAATVRLLATRQRALYLKRELLPLRERIVNDTLLAYNAMDANLFQVLAAKRAHVNVARTYVAALRDYWIARAELEQLLAGRRSSRRFSGPSPAPAMEAPAEASH